jgi:hypothetical protein
MKPKHATLLVALACAFGAAVLDGLYGDKAGMAGLLLLGPAILQSMLAFFWVHYDAAERDYWPSWLAKLAVAGVPLLAVPVYLLRTRPRGARLKVFGGFLLAMFFYLLAASAGSFCAGLLRR